MHKKCRLQSEFWLVDGFNETIWDNKVGEAPYCSKVEEWQPPHCELPVACLRLKGEFPTYNPVWAVGCCWWFNKQKLAGGGSLSGDSYDVLLSILTPLVLWVTLVSNGCGTALDYVLVYCPAALNWYRGNRGLCLQT